MAFIIPEKTARLQATAFVNNSELSAISRSSIIRHECKAMAEMAMKKLLEDCIKTDGDCQGLYQGFKGQVLRLDVYVISPNELQTMLMDAYLQGERDAMRWVRPQEQRP